MPRRYAARVRRHLIAIAVAVACLLAAPAASALDEAGNRCVANGSITGATVIGLSNQGPTSSFLQSHVVSAGVITRWRVLVAPDQAPLVQQLVLLQQVGEDEDRKLAESAPQTVVPGANEFTTRMPVRENTHVGLQGPVATFVCDPQELNNAGVVEGAFPIGEARRFKIKVHVGTPVVAIVEPDRDGDGYGDETQDGCPWNAALQIECPPVTPKVDSIAPKERAILVKVGVSSQAQVQVFGQVSWKVRQKPGQGKGRARQGDRGLTVGLTAGAPRTVLPGTVASFRVRLPKAVLRRLGRLTPRQALRVRITIRTTDLAGRENDRLVTLKLRGRQR